MAENPAQGVRFASSCASLPNPVNEFNTFHDGENGAMVKIESKRRQSKKGPLAVSMY